MQIPTVHGEKFHEKFLTNCSKLNRIMTINKNRNMRIFSDASEMRAWSREQRKQGLKIGFVPTMGALHEGHISLVRAARGLCDVVVASVYVNPTQFSANEDFDVYPRDVEGDRTKLEEAGCCTVFEPRSLYRGNNGDASNVVGREGASPDAHETFVQVERLQKPLCGKSRPHFFKGVTTIVSKLFNIVEPDVAVFGRKDYQQWRVITRMVRDLDFDVEVVGMPICREADGLALSSRNARLTPEARQAALCIPRALEWAKSAYMGKPAPAPADLASRIGVMIKDAGGLVDYVEVLDAQNLQPVLDITVQPTLVAVAAHFPARDQGSVRLIDNCVLETSVGE